MALRPAPHRGGAQKDPISQRIGLVQAAGEGALRVRVDGGVVHATRAASCLLVPRPDDRVLLCGSRAEGWYVLAVLTRAGHEAAALSVEGDLELRLPSGRLSVAAQEGIDLVSGKDAALTAGTVEVRAFSGNVAVERASFVGGLVRAQVSTLKLFGERFDCTVERVVQRIKRAFRSVEESDQLRAAHIDYAADKAINLHGRNALISAEQLVKVDGEQIHVG